MQPNQSHESRHLYGDPQNMPKIISHSVTLSKIPAGPNTWDYSPKPTTHGWSLTLPPVYGSFTRLSQWLLRFSIAIYLWEFHPTKPIAAQISIPSRIFLEGFRVSHPRPITFLLIFRGVSPQRDHTWSFPTSYAQAPQAYPTPLRMPRALPTSLQDGMGTNSHMQLTLPISLQDVTGAYKQHLALVPS